MFTIRREHIAAFDQSWERGLVARLCKRLGERYPQAISGMPEELVQKRVEASVRRAQRAGLTWESSIGAFVDFCFLFAPNFDRHPAVEVVLKDESVKPDERMEMLPDRTTPEDWNEVKARTDPAAWEV